MRDLPDASESGEESQRTEFPYLEMAHRMVPGVEEVSEGTGKQEISS